MSSTYPDIPGYRIERKLGAGGMAQVYLAVQEGFDRRVALKLMKDTISSDEQFRERFDREAKSIGALHHPGITPVYEFGTHEGQVYLSMQYLEHGDLEERIEGNPLDPITSLKLLRQVAEALGHAHKQGIIHRDIKPENLLFSDGDTLMLADFGIARQLSDATTLTRGFVIGSPQYMSPEQMIGEKLDERSDLYSLGVVFYEMLTGTKPFGAGNFEAIYAAKISRNGLKLPGQLKRLQPLLDRLVTKDRDNRFADAGALVEAIDECLREGIPGSHTPAYLVTLVVVAFMGLALNSYDILTSQEPTPIELATALTLEPETARVFLLPDLQPIDKRVQIADGDYQALVWSPGFRAREVEFVVPVEAARRVYLEPVEEPTVAEFHAYLDFQVSKDRDDGRRFIDTYPDSPMVTTVRAQLGENIDFARLAAASEVGDVVAQVAYSELLDEGWGVEINRPKAMSLARAAAESGYAFGAYQYGIQLIRQGDRVSEGVEVLEGAARDGSFLAQNWLGQNLVAGIRVPQDVTRGAGLIERAAKQGYRVAVFNLALALHEGKVVPADAERAQRLFTQAAELGVAQAAQFLD